PVRGLDDADAARDLGALLHEASVRNHLPLAGREIAPQESSLPLEDEDRQADFELLVLHDERGITSARRRRCRGERDEPHADWPPDHLASSFMARSRPSSVVGNILPFISSL